MSLKPYPAYKDSGVTWLGDVPEHWAVSCLKYVTHITMGQSPSSDDCNLDGIGRPFLQGNADFGATSPVPRSYCDAAPKTAFLGDILLSVRAPVGAINVADQNYGIGRGLVALRAENSEKRKFVYYALEIAKQELFSVATGSTYEAVTADQVGSAKVFVPPAAEQAVIAAFLDRETGKIDELIAEQEKLIALLAEKRQATISHAVTKGLNPSATMKDSGVEWLGQVPEHWEVAGLKREFRVVGGSTPKSDNESFWNGDIIWVCPSDLSKLASFAIADSARKITQEGLDSCGANLVPAGSIILSTRAPIGSLAVAKTELCTNQGCKALVPYGQVDTQFFAFLLSIATDELNIRGRGTTFLEMSGEELASFRVTIPNFDEQTTISAFLDLETQKIDDLNFEANRVIDLLKERRTALISAAVTGKIDVRYTKPY